MNTPDIILTETTITDKVTLGLDLGDRQHSYCVLDIEGEILAEEKLPNDRASLEQLSQRYRNATIAMETGTHSPWISRLFEGRGHKVYVANARKLRAISQSNTKSDQEDARMLAKLCRVDPTLLSPVKHRSEACQRALVQLKARDALVRTRVDLSNSVRFLLKSLGLIVPRAVKATAFVRKLRPMIDAPTTALVEPLLQAIDAVSGQIKTLDRQLEELARTQYPDTEHLQQIPGVGPLTALCFVLTLETPDRFAHARDVGAYLGLVPRRDQSGQTDKQLPITKAGNTQLRCLLVNCAHYILGPFGPDTHLRETGLRLAGRHGSSAKKRAVIATARKLAVTMMALWKTKAEYQPLLKAA
jgi:transposase